MRVATEQHAAKMWVRNATANFKNLLRRLGTDYARGKITAAEHKQAIQDFYKRLSDEKAKAGRMRL